MERHRVAKLGIILLGMVVVVYAGNCSSVDEFWMRRDRVLFRVHGPGGSAYAAANGEPVGENYFSWKLDKIVERAKSAIIDEHDETVGYRCMNPILEPEEYYQMIDPGVYVDPLTPGIPGTFCRGQSHSSPDEKLPCGTVLSNISSDEFDCWSEHLFDQLEGLDREQVVIHFSHPEYPYFFIRMSYELVAGDLNYTFHHHSGSEFQIYYHNNRLKINCDVDNFPWFSHDFVDTVPNPPFSSLANNASWIGLWWNISTSMDRPISIWTNSTTDTSEFGMDSKDGEISISMEFLKSFLLDGVLSREPGFLLDSWSLEEIPAVTVEWNFVTTICSSSVGHYTNLWYDPSFTALFLGDIDSPTENSPLNKGNNRKTIGIAVGVSIGVIMLLIVLTAIAVIKVPAVRNFIQPYSSKQNHQSNGEIAPSKPTPKSSDGWTRSSKPLA